MSVHAATLASTIEALENLILDSGYAKKELEILENAGKANLSDPNELAELQGAYQFFEALKNCTKYTGPDGTVYDFTVYQNTTGFFGKNSAQFETLLDNIFKTFDKITIPVPTPGGTARVYDQTTGQPATLFDLISRPNDTFSFQFDVGGASTSYNVPWASSNDNPSRHWNGPIFGSSDSDYNINTPNGNTLHIHEHDQQVCSGGQDQYTISGNAAAVISYSTFGTTDQAALDKTIHAMSAFLDVTL
jgi:hypothetical protein